MSKNFKKSVTLPMTPQKVFKLFVNPTQHKKFAKKTCNIPSSKGKIYKLLGGMIHGHILDYKNNGHIVMTFRGKSWPKNLHSLCTLYFKRAPKGSCQLIVEHHGIPVSKLTFVKNIWNTKLFTPLKKYLKDLVNLKKPTPKVKRVRKVATKKRVATRKRLTTRKRTTAKKRKTFATVLSFKKRRALRRGTTYKRVKRAA